MKGNNKVWISIIIGAILLISFSTTPPRGQSGAPGESTCSTLSGCHFNSNASILGEISIEGFPAAGILNETFNVSVTLQRSNDNAMRAGFQLVALGDSSGTLVNVGTFSNPDDNSGISILEGREYFGHNPAQRFNNSDVVTYTAQWTTPEIFNVDSITLYAAAVFANGDGSRNGDRVINANLGIPMFFIDDQDQDGFTSDVDCNDLDASINPLATEIINNDIDEDCDGVANQIDIDEDGFNSDDDCDDNDASINPDSDEVPNNDIDENCDGIVVVIDMDDDGFNSDNDCDDNNADVNPDADEVPNNDIDENCDGTILYTDLDEDGFRADVDCDDNNAEINPGAIEILDNDIDEDCSGSADTTVTAVDTFVISGSIRDAMDELIPNVDILNATNNSIFATSGDDGRFSFKTTELVRIRFSKNADPRDGVSVADLRLLINHIVEDRLIENEVLLLAGDANDSGSISAADVLLIQNVILGIRDGFPFGEVWKFLPEEIIIPRDSSVFIQAYKIGDINLNASR